MRQSSAKKYSSSQNLRPPSRAPFGQLFDTAVEDIPAAVKTTSVIPLSAARSAIILPIARAASLFPPLPSKSFVQRGSRAERHARLVVDELGVDVLGGAEYIQGAGAGPSLKPSRGPGGDAGAWPYLYQALFTIISHSFLYFDPLPALPSLRRMTSSTYLIPLPFVRLRRALLAHLRGVLPDLLLVGPEDHDLVRVRALDGDPVDLAHHNLMEKPRFITRFLPCFCTR